MFKNYNLMHKNQMQQEKIINFKYAKSLSKGVRNKKKKETMATSEKRERLKNKHTKTTEKYVRNRI